MTVSADSPAGILLRGRRDVFRDDHVTVSAGDAAQNNRSRRYRRGQNHLILLYIRRRMAIFKRSLFTYPVNHKT